MNWANMQITRSIGDEYYFTVIREDGVKGEIQLNMRLLAEEYEDCIVWEEE